MAERGDRPDEPEARKGPPSDSEGERTPVSDPEAAPRDPTPDSGGDAPTPETPGDGPVAGGGYRCDLCGASMLERHCKLVCPACGYQRDCSDP